MVSILTRQTSKVEFPECFRGVDAALNGEVVDREARLEAYYHSRNGSFDAFMFFYWPNCWDQQNCSGFGQDTLNQALHQSSLRSLRENNDMGSASRVILPDRIGELMKENHNIVLNVGVEEGDIVTSLDLRRSFGAQKRILSVRRPSFSEGYNVLNSLEIPDGIATSLIAGIASREAFEYTRK